MNKKIKIIYCNDELDSLISSNFSKGKWGYGKFSMVITTLLKDYLKNRPTLEKIESMEEKLQLELKDLQLQKSLLIDEKEKKFKLTQREAAFLNDSICIIDKDKNKLIPRITMFNNIFKKNVNQEEFYELIEKAGEDFPLEHNFVMEDNNGR
jgi:hypothetical protein